MLVTAGDQQKQLSVLQTTRQKTNAMHMSSMISILAAQSGILSTVPSAESLGMETTTDSCLSPRAGMKDLPKLEAWLEKQKPDSIIKSYQRRWIIVAGAYILWSDKQKTISDDASRAERQEFKGSIHLMGIKKIAPVETANNTKFMVKAKDAKTGQMRDYIFRCQDEETRDFWVAGLNQHKSQYETLMKYLEK